MVSWSVYNFECADVTAREELMAWFEQYHPVEFPDDEDAVFESVETPDGTTGADFAWVDRYLYVTVMGEADHVVHDSMDLWDRAAMADFDGTTETAVEVTLILDTESGDDDEVAAVQFPGVEGMGGQDVMYALAMEHQFRFRSYSAQSPTTQITPHPDAFTFVTEVDPFVEEMAEATDIEPTQAGLGFIRNDPERDGDRERAPTGESADIDAVHSVDLETGEVETYEDPDDVPGDDDDDDGLLDRFRSLLGG